MAKITQALTLKHQANLGEEVEEIAFAAGDEVVILKEWEESYLCKNDAGQLFNVPKTAVEP
jgi:hypothetical protein